MEHDVEVMLENAELYFPRNPEFLEVEPAIEMVHWYLLRSIIVCILLSFAFWEIRRSNFCC